MSLDVTVLVFTVLATEGCSQPWGLESMSLIFLLFRGLNFIFVFFRPLAFTGFIFGFGGFRSINFLPGCLLLEVWVCGGAGCGQVCGGVVQVLGVA